ncbi:hypothetical protein ACPV4S_24535, partial [Vibrio alginolyticus]
TTAILMAAELAASEPQAHLPESVTTPVIETLHAMANMLEQGGYPVDIELRLPAGVALPPLASAVAAELQAAIVHFAVVDSEPAAKPAIPKA